MHAGINCGCNVCGSANSCWCVINWHPGQPYFSSHASLRTLYKYAGVV